MCSQCIDRRFAVLAAGAGGFERADSYKVDLLCDPRDVGEPRTMLASYVEVAQQVAVMSELEFFMRFGEVARVVRRLSGAGTSTDLAARRIHELYRRHAIEVVKVVDEGLAQQASKIRTRSLPESCMLRMVHDPTVPAGRSNELSPAPGGTTEDEPAYFLRRRGAAWEFRFAGHDPKTLVPAIGHKYLYELLQFPDRRFTVSELLVAIHGLRAGVPRGNGAIILDGVGYAAFARRFQELEEEFEEATKNNDLGRQEKLAEEREILAESVYRVKYQGKAKRDDSGLNNVRNSVCNAIRRAMAAMKPYEPDGYDHLKNSISMGFTVIYQPKERLPWSF